MSNQMFAVPLFEVKAKDWTDPTYEIRLHVFDEWLEVRIEPRDPQSQAKRFFVYLRPVGVMDLARFLWRAGKSMGAK